MQMPVDHNSRTETIANEQINKVLDPLCRPEQILSKGHRLHVVFYIHRYFEMLFEFSA